ncbi:TetR/AcrR family transcriptional regulator [Ochrobactrum sp. CGA5]|nr:TetR/AcrR family transcriptional regulator [Ochrobactrum sp. CGA5]
MWAQQNAMNHGGRPTVAESEEISHRIMNSAKALFLRNGYATTSMDAIAGEIGISKRTLYVRHPSKAALFEAVIIDIVNTCVSEIVLDSAPVGSLRDDLLSLSLRILAVATDPMIIHLERAVVGELHQFPQLAEYIDQYSLPTLIDLVVRVLRGNGVREGEVVLLADIFLSITILPQLRRAVLERTSPGIKGVDKVFLERTVDIFVKGVMDQK